MTIASTLTGKLAIRHEGIKRFVREDGAVISKTKGYSFGNNQSNGYKNIRINGKTFLIHRLVAECFIPNTDNKPQVDHIDRNRTNNDFHNLRWVTAKENIDNSLRSSICPRSKKVLSIFTRDGKRNSSTKALPVELRERLKKLEKRERTNVYYELLDNSLV